MGGVSYSQGGVIQMDTKNQKTAQITCLQKNLSAIRKIAGHQSNSVKKLV